MDIAARFGKNIAQLRKDAGLSQTALAARASIHPVNLSEYERGLRQPRLDTLVKAGRGAGGFLVEGIEWIPGEPSDRKRGGYFREDGR